MPGDKIDLEVYAKYVDLSSTSLTTTLRTLVTSIATNSATAGTVIDGGGYNANSASNFPFGGLLGNGSEPGSGPKAYLNYLVFSRDYVLLPGKSGYKRLTTAAKEDGTTAAINNGEGNPHEYLSATITIAEAGYVYVYLGTKTDT